MCDTVVEADVINNKWSPFTTCEEFDTKGAAADRQRELRWHDIDSWIWSDNVNGRTVYIVEYQND